MLARCGEDCYTCGPRVCEVEERCQLDRYGKCEKKGNEMDTYSPILRTNTYFLKMFLGKIIYSLPAFLLLL